MKVALTREETATTEGLTLELNGMFSITKILKIKATKIMRLVTTTLCNFLRDSEGSVLGDVDAKICGGSPSHDVATKFVANGTGERCRAELDLEKVGSPTGGFSVSIYSHDAINDFPDTQIGTASDEIDASSFSTRQMVSFENLSATLVDGETYWIVITKTSGATDNSNHLYWYTKQIDPPTGETEIARREAGVWSVNSIASLERGHFDLYSQS